LSSCDFKNRNIYLKKSVVELENFIKEQKVLDQEAYYDLFLIKSKILNKKELTNYIEKLKKQYPTDKDFFEALKQSFDEQLKQIQASQK